MGRELTYAELDLVSGGRARPAPCPPGTLPGTGCGVYTPDRRPDPYDFMFMHDTAPWMGSEYQRLADQALNPAEPPPHEDEGFCEYNASTFDGNTATIFGGTEQQSEQLINILEAITQLGSQISGTFQIGGQSVDINLGNIFSTDNYLFMFHFQDLGASLGRTDYTQYENYRSIDIKFDMNSIASQANGNVLNELVTTVIHELIHSYGHVKNIDVLHKGVNIEKPLDAAAKILATQLMIAVATNNVDLNRDRDSCRE